MLDLPSHQSHLQNTGRADTAVLRPRRLPNETIEGWVTAEITPYPRPLRLVSRSNVAAQAEGFTLTELPALEGFLEAQFAPPAAQFVLAVVEYPSGPISRWGHVRWPEVDVVLRSPHEWVAQGAPPLDSPDLRRLVDDLARQALAAGWEPAGRGATWCSLRFRQHYNCLEGMLRWR